MLKIILLALLNNILVRHSTSISKVLNYCNRYEKTLKKFSALHLLNYELGSNVSYPTLSMLETCCPAVICNVHTYITSTYIICVLI